MIKSPESLLSNLYEGVQDAPSPDDIMAISNETSPKDKSSSQEHPMDE